MPIYQLRKGVKVVEGQVNAQGGVGTELTAMLQWTSYLKEPGKVCGCAERARQMDQNGIPWCEQNQQVILEWLKLGAGELGIVFFELPARYAIRIAIQRAKAREAQ